MSRFDDLDHRIGRHEGKPHPDCSLCNPALVPFTAASDVPWDHKEVFAPPYPDWGAIWNHRGELVTFVNPASEVDVGASGFWTPVRYAPRAESVTGRWKQTATQMEIGSGRWHGRTRILAIKNTIPNEAGLRSPLGVDLFKWAVDQNTAKLVVEMERQQMFPISEIVHEKKVQSIVDTTIIHSEVRCIPMEPLAALLVDISLR